MGLASPELLAEISISDLLESTTMLNQRRWVNPVWRQYAPHPPAGRISQSGPELLMGISLLNLIEETTRFNRQLRIISTWPQYSQKLLAKFQKLSDDSAVSINRGLGQLGGFTMTLEPPSVPTTLPVVLTRWQGEDNNDPGKDAWLFYSAIGGGDATLESKDYEEIRRNLVSAMID